MGASRGGAFGAEEPPYDIGGKYIILIYVLKISITILLCNKECAHRFPVPLYGNEGRKIDKFSLAVPQDSLKCNVTLTGDSITHAVSYIFVLNID